MVGEERGIPRVVYLVHTRVVYIPPGTYPGGV